MEVININLFEKGLRPYRRIVKECKKIIVENLYENGGTLRQRDIFEREFQWTNLIIARNGNEIVGFLLIRFSSNTHNLKNSECYYYISDIVVKNKYKRQGIGTMMLRKALECRGDLPLVASVLDDNEGSKNLLSKFMRCYGNSGSGRYLRFVDSESYHKIYGGSFEGPIESSAKSI